MRAEVTAGRMGLTRGALTMPAPRKYPLELRACAVRMYRAAEPQPVIRRMAEELGVHHEALRNWIRQAEADAGERGDMLTAAEWEELAALPPHLQPPPLPHRPGRTPAHQPRQQRCGSLHQEPAHPSHRCTRLGSLPSGWPRHPASSPRWLLHPTMCGPNLLQAVGAAGTGSRSDDEIPKPHARHCAAAGATDGPTSHSHAVAAPAPAG